MNQKLSHEAKKELGFNLFGVIVNVLLTFFGKRWGLSQNDTVHYLFNQEDFKNTSKKDAQFFLDTAEEKRNFFEKLFETILRFLLSYIGKKEEKKIEKNNLALKGARGLFENSK